MGKFLDFMQSAFQFPDYEEQDDFFEEDDDFEEDELPPKKNVSSKNTRSEILPEPQKPVVKVKSRPSNKVVPMKNASHTNSLEVCVIKPTNVDEDAREISDTLLSGKAVILNLEGINVNTAQRIIDFTAGACYAINGNLKMISGFIFIATPEAVDISGDFQELLDSMANSSTSSSSSVITPSF